MLIITIVALEMMWDSRPEAGENQWWSVLSQQWPQKVHYKFAANCRAYAFVLVEITALRYWAGLYCLKEDNDPPTPPGKPWRGSFCLWWWDVVVSQSRFIFRLLRLFPTSARTSSSLGRFYRLYAHIKEQCISFQTKQHWCNFLHQKFTNGPAMVRICETCVQKSCFCE